MNQLASIGKDCLPAGWTLHGLPESLITEFEGVAKLIINTRFVPVLWLRFHKKRRRPSIQGESLSKQPWASSSQLLAHWDRATLDEYLFKKGIRQTVSRGDIIFHAGEPAVTLAVLLSGAVDKLKPIYSSKVSSTSTGSAFDTMVVNHDHCVHIRHENRRKGISHMLKVSHVEGFHVLADFEVLNEEPFLETSIATADSELLLLPGPLVVKALEGLPLQSVQQIVFEAFLRRRQNLPRCFPMSTSRLRLSPLFAGISDEAAEAITRTLTPRAVPKDRIIVATGDRSNVMYFVRRGTVKVRSKAVASEGGGTGPDKPSANSPAETTYSLLPGATFGERELMFHDRFDRTFVAATNVDLYLLSRTALDEALSLFHDAFETVHSAANRTREAELEANLRHRLADGTSALAQRVAEIPILVPFNKHPNFRDLIATLERVAKPRVINARQVLVSKCDEADRLIFLSRGNVVVRSPSGTPGAGQAQHFALKEWIGYTCLLTHRWEHTLVAVDPGELWEISRSDFYQALQQHRLHGAIQGATLQLLQPLLHNPNRCELLEHLVHQLPSPNTLTWIRTPNLHPVSTNDQVIVFPLWKPSAVSTFVALTPQAPVSPAPKPTVAQVSRREGAIKGADSVESKPARKLLSSLLRPKTEVAAESRGGPEPVQAIPSPPAAAARSATTLSPPPPSSSVDAEAKERKSPPVPAPPTVASDLREKIAQIRTQAKPRPESARVHTQKLHPGVARHRHFSVSEVHGSLLEKAKVRCPSLSFSYNLRPAASHFHWYLKPEPPKTYHYYTPPTPSTPGPDEKGKSIPKSPSTSRPASARTPREGRPVH
jgi:CRP-like cAMP-binding protein